ncbi:glycosyltransferase family 4 protein [Halobacillus litoralis]|uniref:glycosyltransferase family 4 protein n=1 Tax=Halobacillus litoralis TaxID=45668 RepID=UPI001CFE20C8|nr:glycosyltransferase family 4 protein [Halobacillus litoralis]
MKKILFVTHYSSMYGANKSMLKLISHLQGLSNKVEVLLPKKGELETHLKEMEIPYTIFPYCNWVKSSNEKNLKLALRKFFLLVSSIGVKLKFRAKKYDIIHSNSSCTNMGAIIASANNSKHIWHIREFLEEDYNLEFINKEKSINVMNNADKIISISNAINEKYKHCFDIGKMKTIYNGIDSADITSSKNKNENRIGILLSGYISEQKGHFHAIEAINLLSKKYKKRIRIFIAGEGEAFYELKKLVELYQLEDTVEFLGYVNNLNPYREKCSIALIPSLNEAFGRTLVEAMFSKMSLVVSNCAAFLELVSTKNAYFYDKNDYEALANVLENAIEAYEKGYTNKEVDENYIKAFNKYTSSQNAIEVNDVYKVVGG